MEENTKETGNVLRIPFGGRVLLSNGLYTDKDGNPSSGSLRIGWMDHPEPVGKTLDESIHEHTTPLVELVFPCTESIDAMITHLLLVESTMLGHGTDYKEVLENLENHSTELGRIAQSQLVDLIEKKNG